MNHIFRLIWMLLFAKLRTACPPQGPCRTYFRVLPSDLDVLMHMNNGKYLSLMDLGRVDMMMRSGLFKIFNKRGWYPVVSDQTIQYFKSLQPFQKFCIETRIIGRDEKAIFLEQRFWVGNNLMAQGFVKARFLKKKGGQVSPDELLIAGNISDDVPLLPDWVTRWNQDMITNRAQVYKTKAGD